MVIATREGVCNFAEKGMPVCGKKTETHKYVCDEHARVMKQKYGRRCAHCGADLFNELHVADALCNIMLHVWHDMEEPA